MRLKGNLEQLDVVWFVWVCWFVVQQSGQQRAGQRRRDLPRRLQNAQSKADGLMLVTSWLPYCGQAHPGMPTHRCDRLSTCFPGRHPVPRCKADYNIQNVKRIVAEGAVWVWVWVGCGWGVGVCTCTCTHACIASMEVFGCMCPCACMHKDDWYLPALISILFF